jgi:hypothetical protein
MSDTGQGISVGDAVLQFVGDTQQLDTSIDGLEARVQSRMSSASLATERLGKSFNEAGSEASEAADEVEDAGERSGRAMSEARGEVALLGEEFGVRLPRHVRSFVAELPGVGEALSAAFQATAILFVLEAVVKLTEKVSDFIGTAYIYTQAMKDADAEVAAHNKTLITHTEEMKKLQAAYESVGQTAKEKLTVEMNNLTKALADADGEVAKLKNTTVDFMNTTSGFWDTITNKVKGYANAYLGTSFEIKKTREEADAAERKRLDDLQDAQNKAAELSLQVATKDKEAAIAAAKAKSDAQYEYWLNFHNINEMIQDDTARLVKAVDAQIADMGKSMTAQGTEPQNNPFVKTLLAGRDAASQLGVVLKSDLIQQLNDTVTAYNALEKSGLATDNQLKEIQKTIQSMSKAIDQFDQNTPQVNEFFKAFSQGGKQSEAAMCGFADAYGQGLQKVISGEEGLGQAMEAATKAFIGQIGARALVQGMFYLAQGIADTFWNPARAGADFAASAEFLAIGGAATAVAAAIPGGGSSSAAGGGGAVNTNQPIQTTGQTTQAVSGGTNVQRFAGGGLINHSTLAMVGDSESGGDAPEAVLPLHQDSKAVGAIADALVSRMMPGASGNHTFNNHIFGTLPHSALKKLARQMSREVNRGTIQLQSSAAGRATGRHPSTVKHS